MKTSDFDFDLPERLIAQQGLSQRSSSRLMVVDRLNDTISENKFSDILEFFAPGDCLVLNDTRVIPARFYLKRATGGKIEGLFLNLVDSGDWLVLLKGANRLKIGEVITICPPFDGIVHNETIEIKTIQRMGEGMWLLRTEDTQSHLEILHRYGVTPLPPYISRNYSSQSENTDRSRYQTVYADEPGSVAAPTAGLHFTDKLLKKLTDMHVNIAKVTLHVGMGTFKPVTAEKLLDHKIHLEQYQLSQENADIINQTKENGGKIIAVGTTSVRTLESVALDNRAVAGEGWTDLFITPGYEFKLVDTIITNFHLPKSTLLALISAFAGHERIMNAYKKAVEDEFRFYSYGDSMIIL